MGLLPMEADILPPSDDRVFKLILTSPDAKPVLIDLISSILNRKVVDVAVRNNEIPPEDAEGKAMRLDVNCYFDDNSQIDIEMQASRIEEEPDGQHRNVKGKGVYYLCGLHSSQPAKGIRRYDTLARTYQVTFSSYTVFPERKSYVNSFSLRHDEDGALLCNAIQMIFVELSKLQEIMKKTVGEMTELEKWAVFFRYAADPSQRETVNKVIASKEVLQVAGNLLMGISQDERERAIFRSRKMYQTDQQSNLATAEDRGERRGLARGRAEGRAEGRVKGRAERNLEIAQNLLRIDLPLDQIAIATGLTVEEVEHLRMEESGQV